MFSARYFRNALIPPGGSGISSTTIKISCVPSPGPVSSAGGATRSGSPSWSTSPTLVSTTSSCSFWGSSSTASSLITGGTNFTISAMGGGGGGGGGGGNSSAGGGGVRSTCTLIICVS